MHPYDDPDVIAGQGTIGVEMLRQCRGADRRRLRPGRRGWADRRNRRLRQAPPPRRTRDRRRAGRRERDVPVAARGTTGDTVAVGLFADGVAVSGVGAEPFRLARRYVDDVLLVDTDEICAAMKDVFEDARAVVEPSAALAVAGAKRYAARPAR